MIFFLRSSVEALWLVDTCPLEASFLKQCEYKAV